MTHELNIIYFLKTQKKIDAITLKKKCWCYSDTKAFMIILILFPM